MAQVTLYDQQKNEAGTIDLASDVFEVPVRAEILNLVVRAQRAAFRAGTHSTLNRAAKKASGAKPWRQKGTGRARAGSNISPLWTGGAVTFGPHPRDYGFKINKKVWRLAMRMALSSRLAGQSLIVVKDISFPEIKTKHFVKVKEAFDLGKTLVVAPYASDEVLLRSARNIPGITVITPEQLNVYDILRHKQLLLLEGALESVTARLSA